MNKYQCQVCGAVSYSAASQENLKDNSCLECDGRVEIVDGDKMNADAIMRAFRERAKDSNRRGFSGEASELMEISDLIESLQAQLADAQRREKAAVEMLIKFIKQSDGTCDYCKNHIECAGEQCDEFEEGVGGTGNDGTEFPDWHWQCTDFDYGTCAMLVNTPCNGCFENDCSGFEWRGPQEAREGE